MTTAWSASTACDAGRVCVGGKPVKASYEVKPGDVLELRFGERITRVKVRAVQEIVGKTDAAGMYEEMR